jgi:hypothetical protein
MSAPLLRTCGTALQRDARLDLLQDFRLQDDAWKLAAVKGPLGSLQIPPFEAVAIDVARWWPSSDDEG